MFLAGHVRVEADVDGSLLPLDGLKVVDQARGANRLFLVAAVRSGNDVLLPVPSSVDSLESDDRELPFLLRLLQRFRDCERLEFTFSEHDVHFGIREKVERGRVRIVCPRLVPDAGQVLRM